MTTCRVFRGIRFRLWSDLAVLEPPLRCALREVLSPSSHARDAGAKLADYARLPSLRHYLLVDIKTLAVVHHQIGEAAGIRTRILREGSLELDPPGIRLKIADLFT